MTTQCIEQVYDVKGSDSYPNSVDLLELFEKSVKENPVNYFFNLNNFKF